MFKFRTSSSGTALYLRNGCETGPTGDVTKHGKELNCPNIRVNKVQSNLNGSNIFGTMKIW